MAAVGKCQHNTYGTPQRIKFLENGKCRNAVLYKCFMPYCPAVLLFFILWNAHCHITASLPGAGFPYPPDFIIKRGNCHETATLDNPRRNMLMCICRRRRTGEQSDASCRAKASVAYSVPFSQGQAPAGWLVQRLRLLPPKEQSADTQARLL